MELLFAAVGLFYLFLALMGWALCAAAGRADQMSARALEDEPEWTGIRQISTIRDWSSNPEADEEFARAFEQRKRKREEEG